MEKKSNNASLSTKNESKSEATKRANIDHKDKRVEKDKDLLKWVNFARTKPKELAQIIK